MSPHGKCSKSDDVVPSEVKNLPDREKKLP
jgi:hypothetical protein